MVSKLTIFEPHFEGVQIGPESLTGEESTDATTFTPDTLEAEEPSTKSRRRWIPRLAGLAVLAGVGYAAVRFVRRDTEFAPGMEGEEDPMAEEVAIEG